MEEVEEAMGNSWDTFPFVLVMLDFGKTQNKFMVML